ncbi:MAG: hypothetical protein ACEPO8_14960 [Rhodothermaceae bacterium]
MDQINPSNICNISRCGSCDGFNLQYRYVRIHLDENSLQDTLKIVYEYDKQDLFAKAERALSLKYGFVTLTVIEEDFEIFKRAVEEAALNCIDISAISRLN